MKILTIENRTGKVKLNDAVTPWSADDLIGDIEKVYGNRAVEENLTVGGFQCKADDALETLEIEINSPGGSVLDGYRIYNALQSMRARGVRVIATVNTLAASMGSVILMAADEVKIVEGGRIMIHEASQVVAGDSEDHARAAKTLDEMSAEIAEIYARRTGSQPDEMRALMKKETWMGAKEAVERGFADAIVSFDKKPKSESTDHPMSILSKLFPGNDAVAQVEAAIAENEVITAELQTAKSEVVNLTQANAALQTDLTAAQAKVTEHESAIAEKDARIAELEAAAKVTPGKVADQAAALLASQGHPAPVGVEGKQGSEEILAQFHALKGAERTKFYNEHRDEIRKAQS